jgi:hypothetical protein
MDSYSSLANTFKLFLVSYLIGSNFASCLANEPIRKPVIASNDLRRFNTEALSCTYHIKCLSEQLCAVEGTLQWMLENVLSIELKRTIYGTFNDSVLRPSMERCSIHYILIGSIANTQWVTHMNENIPSFTFRDVSQDAFVLVMTEDPTLLIYDPENNVFQCTSGHVHFMHKTTGLLYFRNVWGNSNSWERSQNHIRLIRSKMQEKWVKYESSLKLRVESIDEQRISSGELQPEWCAKLRQDQFKVSQFCSRLTVATELAASTLNFTVVYYSHLSRPKLQNMASVWNFLSNDLSPAWNNLETKSVTSFIFECSVKLSLTYCNYKSNPAEVTSFSIWFRPFQWNVWLVLAIIVLSFPIFEPQYINSSLLCILIDRLTALIQIIFQQSTRSPTSFSLMFICTFYFVCSHYEDSITSCLIAPRKLQPYENITTAVRDGYKLTIEDSRFDPLIEDHDQVRMMNLEVLETALTFFGVLDELNKTETKVTSIMKGILTMDPDKVWKMVEDIFPGKEKRMLLTWTDEGSSLLEDILTVIKAPYSCTRTQRGLGKSVQAWFFNTGLRNLLRSPLLTFHEAALFIPFGDLQEVRLSLLERKILKTQMNGNAKLSSLDGKLISSRNLVPLCIVYALGNAIGLVLCLVEMQFGAYSIKAPLMRIYNALKTQILRKGEIQSFK